MESDDIARERDASAGAWAVRLACREAQLDVVTLGREALAALDDLEPAGTWASAFQSDPAGFLASHATECADLARALEGATDVAQRARADAAYQRADAVPQQSAAAIILAAGAAAALIIFAVRVGVIIVGPKGLTIRAFKPDRATTETVKATGGLVSALFAPFAVKREKPSPDSDSNGV